MPKINSLNSTLKVETEVGQSVIDSTKSKEDGYHFIYYPDKESILLVEHFKDGIREWIGYPAAGRDYVIPLKEFGIFVDSVFVKAPYINGKTWYEGNFITFPDDTLKNGNRIPYRSGIHRVYHLNGKIKAVVDYENETVQEFDSLGNEKYKVGFNQSEVHMLPTLGNY